MNLKKFIVAVIIFEILLLCACSHSKVQEDGIHVSGNVVDNNYNNYRIGGNLCQIANKLYFNYQKSGLDYGLIEISEDGSQNIYHEGFALKDNITLNHSIFNYKDTIYTVYGNIQYFDFQKKKFRDYIEIPLEKRFALQQVYFLDDLSLLYTVADITDPNVLPLPSKLFLYDAFSKTNRIIIDKEIIGFFPKQSKVYYVINQDGKYQIYVYDMESKQDKWITDIPGYDSTELLMDDDYNLVFNIIKYNSDNNRTINNLYKINLEDVTDFNLVFSCYDYYYNYNICNGTVYICSEEGLIMCSDGREIFLCDKLCRECYIVDDKWVYFVDYNSNLWRITQDGDNLQKVYG